MTFRLGLTGSIGMGKSTTAKIFADHGCAIWDADAAVHRLYGPDGAAVPLISALCPSAIVDGMVDRSVLRSWIADDPAALPQIESVVHPLVQQDRADFLETTQADIAVCDIPLLFETGAQDEFDAVACVYVDRDTQRTRVLARDGMTAAHFAMILSKQMPIDEKCARSDYVIPTDTIDAAKAAVIRILTDIKERTARA